MPRTAVTVQKLDTKGGEVISFASIDQSNGMQAAHTGKQVILLRNDAGESVDVTIPSVACGHGRTGDVTGSIAASQLKAFGPFEDPKLWGDGAALLFINFASQVGTVEIAVVEV